MNSRRNAILLAISISAGFNTNLALDAYGSDSTTSSVLQACAKSLSATDKAEFSFKEVIRYSGVTDKKFPEETIRLGYVRSDAPNNYFIDEKEWEGSLAVPEEKRDFALHSILSFTDRCLIYLPDKRLPPEEKPGAITIRDRNRSTVLLSLLDEAILDGSLGADRPADPTENIPTFIDILRESAPAIKNSGANIIVSGSGKWGVYELILDPSQNFLPIRLEVTKTGDDLYHGDKMRFAIGAKMNRFYPNRPIGKYHLLMEPVHSIKSRDTFTVIDAHVTEEWDYGEGVHITFQEDIQRSNVHLNPTFSEKDFILSAPDHTGVYDMRANPTGPILEWVNGGLAPKIDPATAYKLDHIADHLKSN